jgi:hypothetical protein
MVFSPLNSDDWNYFLCDEKLLFDDINQKTIMSFVAHNFENFFYAHKLEGALHCIDMVIMV